MCGIAGFIDPRTAPAIRDDAVRTMCGAMTHRGPDDSGFFSSATATMGMRRLAVFDPANGHQPMQSPDRRFTLVFNGAIYNFRALRAELAGNWSFRTECDTEVLLAAFVHWRGECLNRLRGMFAFAVWDELEQSLFLARDPFGIKPLYCRPTGERLLFASEINALLASGHCPAELDPIAIADYLAWLSVPAPRTIFRGITSLRPGESATFTAGRLALQPAWSFAAIPPAVACRSREEFLHELRARLDDSIRAHQLADVPVGAFLSGGLDSAAVVGLMSRTGGTLNTFSIDFAEDGYSESAEAAATARHFGTRHESTILRGSDLARDLPTFLGALDQPTGDGINTYYASRAARRGGVTVALSGLGGDEIFGGYPSFRDIPRLARWLPAWHRLPGRWREAALRRLAAGDTRKRKLADFLRHARTVHELGALQRRVFPEGDRHALLHPDARPALAGSPPWHPEQSRLSGELAGAGNFETISAWELRTYMADVLLRDSDVMSMRHSLELRVPLLDRPLIEWLWHQPASCKAPPGRAKSALADALADLLPAHVIQSKKRGFTLPMVAWMKRELRPFLDEMFSDAGVRHSGLFAMPATQQLWREFLAGSDARRWSRVWSLAVLIDFVNRPRVSAPRAVALERNATVIAAAVAPTLAPAPATRTLLLAPEIFASEGGIPRILQIYLRALCELAEPAGAVRLLALNDASIAPADLERHANGRLEASAGCRRAKVHFIRAALRMSRGCDRIVCGHVFLLPVAWLARRMNPRLRYYLVAHGIEVWRPFTLKERVALRGAERIFCVSDYTRRELLHHCPLPPGRAVVLHNALGPAFRIEAGPPAAECPPTILTVTRLTSADRYKGVEHLIAALPAIRRALPETRLRIIGRGDDRARLQELCRANGLADAVEFTGFVDDQRLEEELRSCRLFALPSRKEGFGLVFLEAMAKGRPCVGADAGGIPEVITQETGRLVAYGDVDALARACTESLRAEWNRETILSRARAFSYPAFKARLGELLAA